MKDEIISNKKTDYKAFRSISLISASASIIAIVLSSLALYCRPKDNLSLDNIVSFMGLFFSIVGVVATFYFVILSYQARIIREELIEEKKSAKEAILEAKSQWKDMVTSALYVIYNNYSDLIKESPEKIAQYMLQQARLACRLSILDQDDRIEQIELLGTIARKKTSLEWDEIDEDIELLKQVQRCSRETDVIKNAAMNALSNLKQMKQ